MRNKQSPRHVRPTYSPFHSFHLIDLTGGKPMISSRDDLSFTGRDDCGRMINWPAGNPGSAGDWAKGVAFMDVEIAQLASSDEAEAFEAIKAAIVDMGGHVTCLELGFADAVARAAMLGLRAMRNGATRFEPVESEG